MNSPTAFNMAQTISRSRMNVKRCNVFHDGKKKVFGNIGGFAMYFLPSAAQSENKKPKR